MSVIKKVKGTKKTIHVQCWCEYKSVHPLWKTLWRFFKKLKVELPYGPVMSLLGIYIQWD